MAFKIKSLADADLLQVRTCALNLLARREHSEVELAEKLLLREAPPELIDALINDLTEANLLSNERFAEQLVRSCINKGQGPIKLAHQFKIHALNASAHRLCTELGIDWFAQIKQVYERKYLNNPIKTPQERAKRQRFLQSRGFSYDLIQSLWD